MHLHPVYFAYLPGDYVTVTFLGLNYPGRVTKAFKTGSDIEYEVAYSVDGEIKWNNFNTDELKKVEDKHEA